MSHHAALLPYVARSSTPHRQTAVLVSVPREAVLGGSSETTSETLVVGVGSRHQRLLGGFVMAETEKAKAGRLQKRREKQQAKRERTGDTPQAAAERAERAKSGKQSDEDRLRDLGERTGVYQ